MEGTALVLNFLWRPEAIKILDSEILSLLRVSLDEPPLHFPLK